MIYYEVNGWILPSEEKKEVLDQNLIDKALLILMKREYEWENNEEANKSLAMALRDYLVSLPYQEPTMYWTIDKEPTESQMENFLVEIVNQTEQGQSLLQARGQKLEPIPKDEYWDQEEMDGMTLSYMLMNLPIPGAEGDHGDNYSGWMSPYVD